MWRSKQFYRFLIPLALCWVATSHGAPQHSPNEVAFSPNGQLLAAVDTTAAEVAFIDPAKLQVTSKVKLNGEPTGLVWAADGKRLWVSEFGVGTIAEVDPNQGKVVRRHEVGRYPRGMATASRREWLLAADYGLDRLTILHAKTGKVIAQVPTGRQPAAVAVSPDESIAVVSNLIPATAATDPRHGCDVTLVDLKALKVSSSVRLPPGSTNARGVAIHPDGKTAYVAHTLGRFHLPTTQLDRGWVITNALSIIDVKKGELISTILLDQASDGAADPWGAAVSPDGKMLYVTLSGVHQLAVIQLPKLLELVRSADSKALANDLSTMHRSGLLARVDLPLNGPRGIDVSPDGTQVATGGYFSGNLVMADAGGGAIQSLPLGPQGKPSLARDGERVYHDAAQCFQRWLSCASCHPNARTDGLNWDLLNDGLGNPKNVRSMLWSHRTPPMMSLGVRKSMEVAATAGFVHIQFTDPDPQDLRGVFAYIRALEPAVSPYRKRDGSLTESATRGKKIFESSSVGCADCHPAPLFTKMKMKDVGTSGPLDQGAMKFDTPTLHEIWRTPPYLHDGRAVTLREVLTKHNEHDDHGNTSSLKPVELDDLVQYLLSL